VAVAIQLYMAMSSIWASAEVDLKEQLDALAGRIYVQRPMTTESMVEAFPSPSSSINSRVAVELLAIEGVDRTASSAILFVPLAKSPAPGASPPARALGIERGHENAFLGSFTAEVGELTLTNPDSVILGHIAADYYEREMGISIGVGGEIEVMGQSLTIVGVLETAPDLFNGMVLMDLTLAQDLFDRPGTVSAVILTADNIEDVGSIKDEVETLHPDLVAASQEEIEANIREMYASVLGLAHVINGVSILAVLLFVTIVMVIAVMERRRDIGVLRAIGAQRATIVGMVASEALMLSIAGAFIAGPLWILIRNFIEMGIVDATDLVLSLWMEISLLAVVAGLGASLLPAWRAVQVDPLEALRYE
jgi:ABC-type antimicrobial peptide transport system permease subunit